MSRPTIRERACQARRLVVSEGYQGIARRVRARVSRWAVPEGEGDWQLRVARADLVRAAEIASSGWQLPPPLPRTGTQPLSVAWVTVPPGEGGGGFTTLFRMVDSLEEAGHRCTVYLHDRHGWDLEQHRRSDP